MLEKQLAAQVVAEVKKAVVGKDDIVVKALLAILARGHLLLEDIRLVHSPFYIITGRPWFVKRTNPLRFDKICAKMTAAP